MVCEGGGREEEGARFLNRLGARDFVAGVVDVGAHFGFVEEFVDVDGAGGGAAGEGWGAGVLSEFFKVREDGGGGRVRMRAGFGISTGFSAAAEEEDGDYT